MKIGYCRVSTDDQSLDIHREQLKVARCEEIYEEKRSGANMRDQPQLQAALKFLRSRSVVSSHGGGSPSRFCCASFG